MTTRFMEPIAEAGIDHKWVRDIRADELVRGLYMVKVKKSGVTKRGDLFLSLTLMDCSGDIEARVWDNAEAISSRFKEGDIVELEGRAVSYRNQIQLTLSDLKASEADADFSLFLESTPKDINQMMENLKRLLKKIDNPHLKDLTNSFMADSRFVSLFKKAPAAKNFHHGYIGGLLEHTLSVCHMAIHISKHYSELDKDLLTAGAFLHDIGKIREFKIGSLIDYTDEGRLLGHLVLGVEMIDEKLGIIKNFPRGLGVKVRHLILSHHGEYEFGSPKRPKFLEAFALHLIDDLDAKINGLSRYMERDQHEGDWTDFNRLFSRYLLKEDLSEPDVDSAPARPRDDKQQVLFSE